MKEVVIASCCRTPIGAFGGTLKKMNGPALAAITMGEAVKRAGINPEIIDDIRYGCCLEHHDNLNVARVAALMADLPVTVPAVTINRVCVSGMEAVASGMAMIQADMADVVLAGGVEHMSGVPYAVPGARWGCRLQDHTFVDAMIHALHCGSHLLPLSATPELDTSRGPAGDFLGKPYIMGHTAEFVAQKLGISREEMDEVALRSQNNAEKATREGLFRQEIVPVSVPAKRGEKILFKDDEHFRPGLTLEQLSKLPPAFLPDNGKVTAGNSSGLNDGSAAMLIMSMEAARAYGIQPLAKIRGVGRGGCHPAVMGLSPVPAVHNLLEKTGLKIGDFERVEVNEAFASQYIGCERELGLNREITNVNGSGIGLGHPIGATGCRILVTLLHELRRSRKNLGMATLCGGGGVSMACVIEAL